MTLYQQRKLVQLQNELRLLREFQGSLPLLGEGDGYVFTQVKGVTVILIKRASPKPYGGFVLPSVMSYRETGERPNTSLDAAVWADDRFAAQSGATIGQRGHLGPIVGLNWCCAVENCPCRKEGRAELARRNGVALQ